MEDVNALFFQRWYHSREEDSTGAVVYRPSDFPLPPSRFREALEFTAEGTATYFGIGGDDRHVPISGQWTKINHDAVQARFVDSSAPAGECRIEESAGSHPRLNYHLVS